MNQPGQNKPVAVVSGGSNGIGAAIVAALAEEGMTVVNADLTFGEPPHSGEVYFRPCDVSNGQQVDQLREWVQGLFDIPQVLVINAGIGVHEKLTEGDPEKWQKVMDTNVMGALRLIRSFAPAMLGKKNAHILFISSVAAGKSFPYGGVYSASKTALEVIAETLRMEVGRELKVTVISSGITDTRFFEAELSGGRSIADFDIDVLQPEGIAAQVVHALHQPHNLVVNKIITRPVGQEF